MRRQCEGEGEAAALSGLETDSGGEDLSYCTVFLFAALVLIPLLQLWRGQ